MRDLIDDMLEGKLFDDEAPEPKQTEQTTHDLKDMFAGIGSTAPTRAETDDGTVLARASKVLIDPKTFDMRWRLTIPEDVWDYVEVICDGKALELTTSPMSDGRYKVTRTVRGYRPTVIEDEEVIFELRDFSTTKEFIRWMENLTPDSMEAYRQIYYDRWCFDSASHKDRTYYELLEEEMQQSK